MHAAFPATVYGYSMIASLLLFFLASTAMLHQIEPFHTWFYSFAWWSYIIFVESFLGARGYGARLFANPARFLLLLPLSISLWLLFEAFNFRLQNWHYLDLPSPRGLRWCGFAIAFATVLPALFTTRNLLDYLGLFRDLRRVPVRFPRPFLHFVPMGLGLLLLPLLFPTVCYPLVWLGFIFLLEPVNNKYGTHSILHDLEQGTPRNLCLLLTSGFCCGVLWECWNFWAGSKWIYTIPYLGFIKIFEMPVLGFLGFPPFAVECYVMVNAFFILLRHVSTNFGQRPRILIWSLLGLAAIVFDIVVLIGIDAFTVVSFRNGK